MTNYQEKIRQFHGHLGPYVVLGYRMGKYAKFHLKGIEKINVQINRRPPISCILDGLQLSTSCTMGKNRIGLLNSNKFIRVTFFSKKKKISVTLKPKLQLLLKKSQKSALKFIKESKYSDLFKLD